MAAFVLTDAYLVINSQNVSSYVQSVSLNVEVDDIDKTAMGATYRAHLGGLKQGTFTITFNQDVANGLLDAIMWPLLGTSVTFELRATSSAVSTSNPKWTGSVLISQWNPVANGVGELAQVQVTFPTDGTITRATA